ncbi:DUF4145 domain-containing protein [Vibrio algarum]|uniref:DUF4145 domain-containing protein n=1 Tax=Vibrio algarum TaxID=3020714 RepID=A0ABT4YKZ7_9VIBR|nr:DUF4145 domain-containing protein [Vibrio sp. KJ40-1]MDB1122231.1 DUF4145 domain-containing protein [Vibrio sp. KJ40-1]
MNGKSLTAHFRSDNIPTWPCPECGANSLTNRDDGFQKQYKVPVDHHHPAFDPDWIEYVFTLNLKCTIPECGCGVMCVGTGEVSQEYLDDGSSDWEWFDNFEVKYFQPPLQIFTPPKETPFGVKEALTTSFSNYFSSPSTSLSTLRAALEVLLGEMEVASVDEKGNFLSLAKRIGSLPENYRKIIEPANAIRWLGNDGTHSGYQIRKSDVVDGYKIFEHILEELYPEKKASIDALVARINEDKGVKR